MDIKSDDMGYVSEKVFLYENVNTEETPYMMVYRPAKIKSDCAILIFPGGGYRCRAAHEGKPIAEFFASYGIVSVVVEYRVCPNYFPIPLQDAQRALQLLRYNAQNYGISKDKIAVMGFSAGAHLAATLSTYRESVVGVPDMISQESILPNAQILCYGVLTLSHYYAHKNSAIKLLGDNYAELKRKVSPVLLADKNTPPAFLWHTLEDNTVPVENSLEFVKKLHKLGIKAECHIFPDGVHGLAMCKGDSVERKHARQWLDLLVNWMKYIGLINMN